MPELRWPKINRKRVTRLLRVNHCGAPDKECTTIADKTAPPALDLLMRD